MNSNIKRLVVIALVFSVFALTALPALATAINVGLNYGTLSGLGTRDLREGIMAIINVILGFLGIIAIIIILYGGFVWLTSAGSEDKVSQAKKIISAGIVGLVIIFISYAIVVFVITELVTATGAAT